MPEKGMIGKYGFNCYFYSIEFWLLLFAFGGMDLKQIGKGLLGVGAVLLLLACYETYAERHDSSSCRSRIGWSRLI